MRNAHPLDRPVWNCLNGRQAGLARVTGAAVRIDPRYGPFAAASDDGPEAQAALAATLAGPDDSVWLVEPTEWSAPTGTRVIRTATLLQMVAEYPAPVTPADLASVLLGESDAAEMRALAFATEPGPWGERTHRYGDFFGVSADGRLAAMAGERMRPGTNFSEVSGVCTWPEFRGQGIAAGLIRRVMAGFTARNEVPFLHSYAANTSAIRLYENIGFRPRREMVVTVLALA